MDATGYLMIVAGIATLLFTSYDMLVTGMAQGYGWLSRKIAAAGWRLALRVSRGKHHRLLSLFGIASVLTSLGAWVVLLWAGWSLIFCADATSVVTTTQGAPTNMADRVYYTGYTILSLGNGDLRPVGHLWQMLTVAASMHGLLIVTFAVSYLVPVIQAATTKRGVAVEISLLGTTPAGMLLRAWDGEAFTGLISHLPSLTERLIQVEQQHLTYPPLHYFHSLQTDQALSVQVSVLDEALTLLEGLDPAVRPATQHLAPVRRGVTALLGSMVEADLPSARDTPAPPSLGPLRDAGIPCLPDAEWEAALAGHEDRRRLLLGLVQASGWTWDDVRRPNEPR